MVLLVAWASKRSFWVAQRFSAAMSRVFSTPALAAEVKKPPGQSFLSSLL